MTQPIKTGTHLWLILHKAYQAVREHDLRSIEATGLGMTDFAILEVLLHKGSLPVNTIGDKVLLTSGSITTAVDRLEAKKLVKRTLSNEDRRVRIVHLTDAGEELIGCMFEVHQRALEKATSGLDEAEKAQLAYLLKKLGHEAQKLL